MEWLVTNIPECGQKKIHIECKKITCNTGHQSWCGIHKRKIVGPFFFDRAIDSTAYLNFLQMNLTEYLNDMPLATRRDFWFQQDGAPPHWAILVRNWLNINFHNRWIGRGGPVTWPPRSPDLTTCDFCLWSYLKQIIYKVPVTDVNDLQQRIRSACDNVTPEMLKNVEKETMRRLQQCILHDGGYVEGKKKY